MEKTICETTNCKSEAELCRFCRIVDIDFARKKARQEGEQAEHKRIFDYIYSVSFIRRVDVDWIKKGLGRKR